VKKWLIFIILLIFSEINAEETHWNNSRFEKYWNIHMHPMMFRDPIWLTPFEFKMGVFNYGNNGYWKSFTLSKPMGDLDYNNSPVTLSPGEGEFSSTKLFESRVGFNLEFDIFRWNFPIELYHQNYLDVQMGIGYSLFSIPYQANLPDHWENSAEGIIGIYKYAPQLHSGVFSSSITWQRSNNWFLYLLHTIGRTTGPLYQTKGGDSYLVGSGTNKNFGLGFKYVHKPNKKTFAYTFGIEVKFGQIILTEFDDPLNISHIDGVDMQTGGIYLTFGAIIGGKRTDGDIAHDYMMKNDYISASEHFETFLKDYSVHGKRKKAQKLLEFCYQQMPYQRFEIGLEYLEILDYDEALEHFNYAYNHGEDDLKFEVTPRLNMIANTYLDSVKKYRYQMKYIDSEMLIQKAWHVAPDMRNRADHVLALVYIDQGNVLNNVGNYESALNKYIEATYLDSSFLPLLENKKQIIANLVLQALVSAKEPRDIHWMIESLEFIIELQPKLASSYSKTIIELKDKLEIYESFSTQNIIDNLVLSERKRLADAKQYRLQLGETQYNVELLLGNPDEIDIIEDSHNQHYEMWSYWINGKQKRFYFRDYILVKMEIE
jgi:tetratricopeptide (TPR) repeat protein